MTLNFSCPIEIIFIHKSKNVKQVKSMWIQIIVNLVSSWSGVTKGPTLYSIKPERFHKKTTFFEIYFKLRTKPLQLFVPVHP